MKRLLVLFLSVYLSSLLFACGNSKSKDEEIASLQAEINELKNSISSTTGETTDNTTEKKEASSDVVNKTDVVSESEEDKAEIIPLKKGEMYSLKKDKKEAELTIDSVTVKKQIDSKSDNMFAQYFPEQQGEKYLDVELTVKNIGGDSIGYSMFEDYNNHIVVQFDGKYNYTMQQLDIFNSAFSKYWSLDPLKSYEVHWIALVPDEVTDKPYEITFTVGDKTYSYKGE